MSWGERTGGWDCRVLPLGGIYLHLSSPVTWWGLRHPDPEVYPGIRLCLSRSPRELLTSSGPLENEKVGLGALLALVLKAVLLGHLRFQSMAGPTRVQKSLLGDSCSRMDKAL